MAAGEGIVKLNPGDLCYADGTTYEIDGRHSTTHLTARECATGRMVTLAIKDLRVPPSLSGTAADAYQDPLAWQRAARLAKDLTPWLGHQRIPTPTLAAMSSRHGLCQRQLQRLRNRFESDPRTSSLLPGRTGRRRGARVLDERLETVIAHAIKKHYWRREQPNVAYLVDRIGSLCRQLDLVAPTRATVQARLKDEEGYEQDRVRRGSKAAKQRWEPRTGGLTAQRPFEIVQIDHTRVDVLLVSDDRQRVIGRPWITLAIDVFTRCVVGWYLTMDAPSSISVALCIEHMALPKPENVADPGVWPMFGKPEVILVDNGKDFRADALKSGCAQHGIELRWRPVKRPHYGAHIERLNGTLMRMVHLLKGTTFSNTRQRADYDSEGRATMTFAEVKAWLVQSICRNYHVKPHSALGISPLLAWEQGSDVLRPTPQLARPVDFRLDFLPRDFRRIRRTGIEFHRSRYWHSDLAAFLRQQEDAEIRFDPRDLSCIWVKAGRLGFVQARAIAGRAIGDTLADRRMTSDERRRMNAELDEGFARRDAIEATAAKQTRTARQGKAPPKRVQPDPPAEVVAALLQTAAAAVPLLALPAPVTDLPTAPLPTVSEREPIPQPPLPAVPRAPSPAIATAALPFEIWS
jgi:putative transposase